MYRYCYKTNNTDDLNMNRLNRIIYRLFNTKDFEIVYDKDFARSYIYVFSGNELNDLLLDTAVEVLYGGQKREVN